MIVLDLNLPTSRLCAKTRKKPPSEPRYDVKLLIDNESVLSDFVTSVDREAEKVVFDEKSAESLNNAIVQILQSSTETSVPVKSKTISKNPWITAEYIRAREAMLSEQRVSEKKRLRKKVEKLRKKLRNDFYTRRAAEINTK